MNTVAQLTHALALARLGDVHLLEMDVRQDGDDAVISHDTLRPWDMRVLKMIELITQNGTSKSHILVCRKLSFGSILKHFNVRRLKKK